MHLNKQTNKQDELPSKKKKRSTRTIHHCDKISPCLGKDLLQALFVPEINLQPNVKIETMPNSQEREPPEGIGASPDGSGGS